MARMERDMLARTGDEMLASEGLVQKDVNARSAALRADLDAIGRKDMPSVEKAVTRDLAGSYAVNGLSEMDAATMGAANAEDVAWVLEGAMGYAAEGAALVIHDARSFAAHMALDCSNKYRQACKLAADTSATKGWRAAMVESLAAMAREGITCNTYTDKNGVTYRVPVDVGIRTAMSNAGLRRRAQQTLDIAERYGQNLVEVSITAGARPSHREWQGEVYMLEGSSPKYGNFYRECQVGDLVHGFGGYNCRHQIAITHEGASRQFKDPLEGTGYTQEEAYAAQQRQRRYENEIRKMKREREVLSSCGLDTKDVNARIRAKTAQLNAHVAEHPAILRREKHREGIHPVARQRAGAYGAVPLDKSAMKRVTAAANGTGGIRGVQRGMANGNRRSPFYHLSESDISMVASEAGRIGVPLDVLRFNEGCRTGLDDFSGFINVGGTCSLTRNR